MQVERWERQVVWVGERSTGRSRGGEEPRATSAPVVFNSFLLPFSPPPPLSIIALECTRLTPTPTGQNKWNQPCQMEKLSAENVLIVGNFGAAGILQESHFGKVGALASHYKQSNLGGEREFSYFKS